MDFNGKLPPLDSLPGVMYHRARWAREMILSHPELVEVDEDEFLAWVYSEEDETWYSIAGNYSSQSPMEKMEKRRFSERKRLDSENRLSEKYLELEQELKRWNVIRKRILERDSNTCQLCLRKGVSKLHIHHILKRREGGSDYDDNLLTVCPPCHRSADTNLYNPEWL